MATFGPYKGVVDKVHDGDTVYCKLDLGFELTVYARVRVFGINAPELSTDAGKLARDFAQSIMPVGTVVEVLSHGWDKYGGRIDGEIQIVTADIDFAKAMVDSGNAVWVSY